MTFQLKTVIQHELTASRDLFLWDESAPDNEDKLSQILSIKTKLTKQNVSTSKISHILQALRSGLSENELKTKLSAQAYNKLTNSLGLIHEYRSKILTWDQKMSRVIPTYSHRKMQNGIVNASRQLKLLARHYVKYASAAETATDILLQVQ